jgi:hypothetical protein
VTHDVVPDVQLARSHRSRSNRTPASNPWGASPCTSRSSEFIYKNTQTCAGHSTDSGSSTYTRRLTSASLHPTSLSCGPPNNLLPTKYSMPVAHHRTGSCDLERNYRSSALSNSQKHMVRSAFSPSQRMPLIFIRHVGLGFKDVAFLSPKFWTIHTDPALFHDGAAATLLTIHYNLCMGTLSSFARDRQDLHPILASLAEHRSMSATSYSRL